MKLTVITVTRNSASTLPYALRSVAEQSMQGVEHIVIDGASSDTTTEVIKLTGAHVAKFVSEPDCGIYDAMNKGLQLATGDIVSFLNADDRYANSGVLERVTEVMNEEGLDVLFGDVIFFQNKYITFYQIDFTVFQKCLRKTFLSKGIGYFSTNAKFVPANSLPNGYIYMLRIGS